MPGLSFRSREVLPGVGRLPGPGAVRICWLAMACLALALLGGCDYTAEGSKLGLYRSGSGEVTAYVLLCPGQYVTDVELDGGSDPVPGSDQATVLWKIHAGHRTSARRFTIGSAPAGFTTVKPFTSPLGTSQDRAIWVFLNKMTVFTDFTGKDLWPGRVYVQGPGLLGSGAHVTPAKFESVRQRSCQLIQGPGG